VAKSFSIRLRLTLATPNLLAVPPISTRALILHGFPYGETSRILRLLTFDHGLRSVVAKGAQRPRNRFGGILEPFTEGEAHFNLREGRELFTLTEFSLLRSRQAIGRDLGGFAAASLIAELALRFATEEPFPQLYAAAATAFDQLCDSTRSAAPSGLRSIWIIIGLLGYLPEMRACVRCGRDLPPDESSRFDAEAGGAACRGCRPTGRLISGTFRSEILDMASGNPNAPLWNPSNRTIHSALLQTFLATHLTSDRPLRSLPLFMEQLKS